MLLLLLLGADMSGKAWSEQVEERARPTTQEQLSWSNPGSGVWGDTIAEEEL